MSQELKELKGTDVIQGFVIPETLFGYTAFSLMIPPYPMSSALFLGWNFGTTAALMQKVWSPFYTDITGVDLQEPPENLKPEKFFNYSADKFVEWCDRKFDFVCIDLYNGNVIPDFVFSDKFVDGIGRITGKMLAINLTFYNWIDFMTYDKHFIPDACKTVNRDKVMFMVPKVVISNGQAREEESEQKERALIQ